MARSVSSPSRNHMSEVGVKLRAEIVQPTRLTHSRPRKGLVLVSQLGSKTQRIAGACKHRLREPSAGCFQTSCGNREK